MTRNEQLKQILDAAFDLTVKNRAESFEDVDVDLLKRRLRADMNKMEITQEFNTFGVTNASDVAQFLIGLANTLDKK